MNIIIKVILITLLINLCVMWAQIPLEQDPCWSYTGGYPHFLGLGDINNDGYLDLAVANEDFPVYVFINNGGSLPSTPTWQSSDAQPSYCIALGDYDNDGDLDLVDGGPYLVGGRIKLYENVDGTLNPNPVWSSASKGAMDIAWGDVNGDGYLDLAAVDMLQSPCVFINDSGSFTPEPNWQASDYDNDLGVAWFDVDMDGYLELAVVRNVVRVYKNNDGTLETIASWVANPPQAFEAGGAATGDVNMDGWLDLFVANGTTYGSYPDYVYMNIGGTLETSPSWVSAHPVCTWKATFGDIDGDGYLDVAASPFYNAPFVFLNDNGTLVNYPIWFGNVNSVPGIALGDIDNEGIIQCVDTLYGNDTLKLFYLSHYPIHKLDTIKVDGVPVPLSDYCYIREFGWFSLKNIPASGSVITIQYSYSIDMELGVSGTSSNIYLFDNTNYGIEEGQISDLKLQIPRLTVYPNPFKQITDIRCQLTDIEGIAQKTELKIYDCSGRLVKNFSLPTAYFPGLAPQGGAGLVPTIISWDGTDNKGQELSGGIYFIQLKANNFSETKKVIKLK